MRRWVVAVVVGLVLSAALALGVAGTPPASASASVSPGGATLTAGQGATARVTFTPAGAITCGEVSGGAAGVSATLDRSGCADAGYTTTLRVSTAPSAAPGTYTFTVQDTADGDSATFSLTVRAAATTTTPTTTPPTTAAPTTVAPTTTPPSTAPPTTPAPTTTRPATTTTAPAGAEVFASLDTLVAEGLPEEGAFVPLVGAGFRDCLPLTRPCGDPASGLLLVPARATQLVWAAPPGEATPLPQLAVRAVLALQPVGQPSTAQPSTVNYLLSLLDLADGGQPKSLPRSLNAEGQLVSTSADQPGVELTAAGVAIPADARTFLAAEPFAKPSKLRTATVSEASPAVPIFLGSQRRVLYGVRAAPAWDLGIEVLPLLGSGSVPYLVRTADGETGLVVPVPPGADLAARAAPTDRGGDDDGNGDGFPIVPVVVALAVVALLAGGVGGGRSLRRRRAAAAEERERAASRERAEAIIRSQPRRFRR